ncbi:hypothetical protein VCV18_009527 [Metarhizium anisopliae]
MTLPSNDLGILDLPVFKANPGRRSLYHRHSCLSHCVLLAAYMCYYVYVDGESSLGGARRRPPSLSNRLVVASVNSFPTHRHIPGVGLAAAAQEEVSTNLLISARSAAALARSMAAIIMGGIASFGSQSNVTSEAAWTMPGMPGFAS